MIFSDVEDYRFINIEYLKIQKVLESPSAFNPRNPGKLKFISIVQKISKFF